MKHYIKQDVNGPHRSPKTQFQSKSTFAQINDYAIKLREKKTFFFNHRYILLISLLFSLWKKRGPLFEQICIHFTQECSGFITQPSGFGDEDLLNFRWYIFEFSLVSPLGKPSGPSFEETWISLMICTKFDWKSCSCFLVKCFKYRNCICAILLTSPLGKSGTLPLKIPESSVPKNAWCHVSLRWFSDSWEEFR